MGRPVDHDPNLPFSKDRSHPIGTFRIQQLRKGGVIIVGNDLLDKGAVHDLIEIDGLKTILHNFDVGFIGKSVQIDQGHPGMGHGTDVHFIHYQFLDRKLPPDKIDVIAQVLNECFLRADDAEFHFRL